MKYSLIFLIVLVASGIVSHSAHANQANNNPNPELPVPNSADLLTTEPVTINQQWHNINRKKIGETLIKKSDRSCNQINPIEIIENPMSFFRECPPPENAPNSPYNEQLEYFKVPKLDGGIKLPVKKF